MPPASPSLTRISQLRQRLRELGAKPCHEDRVLRSWTQNCSYDTPRRAAVDYLPLALRNELPALEAELAGLARVRSEHPAGGHGSHDRSPSPTLPRRPSPQSSPASGRGGERERPSISLAGEGVNEAQLASSDNEGVARLLVELHDGQMVESVLLPRGGLCVSTQVGCAVGCVFCMSGRNGLQRQLGSAEIVAQVVLARRRRKVDKVVFMGMGEPAHNLDNVLEAIEVLGVQGNIGHKNLVLSTVGDVRVFERLMDGLGRSVRPEQYSATVRPELVEGTNGKSGEIVHASTSCACAVGANAPYSHGLPLAGAARTDSDSASIRPTVKPALALSLHSTDDALRAQLLPHAPRIPVAELAARAEAYARATRYPTQYQWTLIEGVNDGDPELERIVELLTGKYAIMNFIPFNDVDGLPYRRPSPERIAYIASTLRQRGIICQMRDSAGQEIAGACGQLRARAVNAG